MVRVRCSHVPAQLTWQRSGITLSPCQPRRQPLALSMCIVVSAIQRVAPPPIHRTTLTARSASWGILLRPW